MSLVDAIPPLLLDQDARTSVMAIRSLLRALKSFTTIAIRRSPVLLVVLGAWEATRRNQSRVLDLEASIAQLSTKIAEERARIRDKDVQITALENKIVEHNSQGVQWENDISDLERQLEDARSKESSLVQQLAEGRDAITASHTRVEALESRLMAEEAEIKQLKDALKEETARVMEGRDWKAEAVRREGELVRELGQMQEAIVGLEGCCGEKQRDIGSLMRANEELQTEVDEARAKDNEISALKERALECQRLVAEKDALLFDLTTKFEKLEFDQEIIGDIPDRDSTFLEHTMDETTTVSHSESEAMVQRHDYELKIMSLNNAVELGHQVQKQKDDTIAELEGKVAEMDRERREKETRVQSLLNVTSKQEERLEELEARVLVLTSTNEGLDGLRTKERERFEEDVQTLRRELEDTNEMITKVESKIVELEAEAEVKDAQVQSLSQAKQELKTRVVKREKSLADLRAKFAAGQGSLTPSKPRKLQKPSRSKEGLQPDAQTCAQYEEKIAELTDKLSECHRLLKAGFNSPLALPPSPLWGPPPYEPAATPRPKRDSGSQPIAAASTVGFESNPGFQPELEQRERFSAPQWS